VDGEKALKRETPGRYRRPVSFGRLVTARTRRGHEALKAAAPFSLPSGGARGRQCQEGKDPERGTTRARGEHLGGSSPWTLRRFARREDRWWTSRRGYPNPARGTLQRRDPLLYSSGSAGPRLCRRAGKPRRGCIAGMVFRRLARARRSDAAVRGCRDMSLKGHESARGADPRPSGREEVRRMNTRRASKRRTGRTETHSRPGSPGCGPRSATKPHERPHGSPRGGIRHSLQPSHLWRATSMKDTESLVRTC
jgi:hypothetical protein